MEVRKIFKKYIWKYMSINHPKLATKILYRKIYGCTLNLDPPKKFSEKMQYLKFYQYSNNPIITECVDKYAVRDYVKKHNCECLLNDLIGCWNNPDDIPWDCLPEKFALKCTHGCGFNIICNDKSKLKFDDVKILLNKWLGTRYGVEGVELLYDNIPPRIICEKYIEGFEGSYPVDYKLFCCYGNVKFLYVETGKSDGKSFLDYFTPDWEWIPVKSGNHENRKEIARPEGLEEMYYYAKILGESFPFTRIDFYYEGGRLYLGELTFLPSGGFCIYTPQKYDLLFGQMIQINDCKE